MIDGAYCLLHIQIFQICAVILVLRYAIIVKTTIHMNCTKGLGKIFNKLIEVKKII